MKYFSITLLIAMFLSGPAIYAADEQNKKVLKLNECINIAIENNTSIKASEEDKKKAQADYKSALAQRLVLIDANAKTQQYPKEYNSSFQKKNNKLDFGSSYYNIGMALGVTASISLYNEKKAQTQNSAKSGIKLSHYQSKKTIADVIFNIKKTYYSYNLARQSVILEERILKRNEERLKMTNIFYKNAQKTILDLSKAQLDFSEAQMNVLKAKNNERLSREELFKQMGIEDAGLEFLLEHNEVLPDVKYSTMELNKLGDMYYPDLQILRMQNEMTKFKIAIEKGGHYPDVDFMVGGILENGGFTKKFTDNFRGGWKPTAIANFVARFPIYSSGLVSSRVAAAESEYNKGIYKEKEAILSLKTMIGSNYTSLQELKEQIKISKIMKDNANKHILLAKKQYESGAGTQLDLHDATISVINAEKAYLKAKYDYMVTIARLSSIVGLGEDSLCKK